MCVATVGCKEIFRGLACIPGGLSWFLDIELFPLVLRHFSRHLFVSWVPRYVYTYMGRRRACLVFSYSSSTTGKYIRSWVLEASSVMKKPTGHRTWWTSGWARNQEHQYSLRHSSAHTYPFFYVLMTLYQEQVLPGGHPPPQANWRPAAPAGTLLGIQNVRGLIRSCRDFRLPRSGLYLRSKYLLYRCSSSGNKYRP